ncbi:hypothetical protein VTN96DRAFT_7964 [Rasamsonia emersonii]
MPSSILSLLVAASSSVRAGLQPGDACHVPLDPSTSPASAEAAAAAALSDSAFLPPRLAGRATWRPGLCVLPTVWTGLQLS